MSRDIHTWCQSTRALPIPGRWRKRKKLEFRRLLSHLDVEIGQHEAAFELEGFSVFTSALRKGRITANVITMPDVIHVFVISVRFSDGTRWSAQCGKRKPTVAAIVLLSRLRISGEGRRFTVDKLDGLPFLSPGPVNVGRNRMSSPTPVPVQESDTLPMGNPGTPLFEIRCDVFSSDSDANRAPAHIARPIDDRPSNFIGGDNHDDTIGNRNLGKHFPGDAIPTTIRLVPDDLGIAWCNHCTEKQTSEISLANLGISADIRRQLLYLSNRLHQRQPTAGRHRCNPIPGIAHCEDTKQKTTHFWKRPNSHSCIGAVRFLPDACSDEFGAQFHSERYRVHERGDVTSSISTAGPAPRARHHLLQ